MEVEVDKLKQEVFSDDWEQVKYACNRLGEIGGEEVFWFLLTLLEFDNSGIRSRAALALRDMADSRAVKPLIAAIRKPANHNYTGTMVYALETLECGNYLKEIFEILFYESYESKVSAFNILDEQEFEFTRGDLYAIKSMWEGCKKAPETCPAYEDAKDEIQRDVDWFMHFLEEEGGE